MCSRFLSLLCVWALPALSSDQRILRVCADPNNLRFSNSTREGLENRLAEIVARHLGATLEYTWWSERKSFLRDSLNAGRCDVVLGVPAEMTSVAVTRPYYRSTYVFVSRKNDRPAISSLTDPRLEKCRIGVHVVGDDYAPPAIMLARRGRSANIVGFSLFGKYGEPNPPARIIEAVGRADVDVAIVWGPFAGFFAKRESSPLEITPVSPAMFLAVPFAYDISARVRKGDDALRAEIDGILVRRRRAIQDLLDEYEVPRCESSQLSSDSSH